jgi:hypothetical protein
MCLPWTSSRDTAIAPKIRQSNSGLSPSSAQTARIVKLNTSRSSDRHTVLYTLWFHHWDTFCWHSFRLESPISYESRGLEHIKNVRQSSRKYCQQILCQGRKTAKTILKSAKTAKIHFCRQKFSNFSIDQFSPFGPKFFFCSFKSHQIDSNYYKRRKKVDFFLMSSCLLLIVPLCRRFSTSANA